MALLQVPEMLCNKTPVATVQPNHLILPQQLRRILLPGIQHKQLIFGQRRCPIGEPLRKNALDILGYTYHARLPQARFIMLKAFTHRRSVKGGGGNNSTGLLHHDNESPKNQLDQPPPITQSEGNSSSVSVPVSFSAFSVGVSPVTGMIKISYVPSLSLENAI